MPKQSESASSYEIADLRLADEGRLKIEWAMIQMPVLQLIRQRFATQKPFKGLTIGACLHVTSETANLMITLAIGGASVSLCASNPLSTQDPIAASLVKHYGISTFAVNGENNASYYNHLHKVLSNHPQITMDDGADLVSLLHQERKDQSHEILGSSEETTTGVIRLKALEKAGKLLFPVIAVNDSATKHMFDNRYGTGQSAIDGILRATNILLAGKKFVTCGYGWCSRGIAQRAAGMGAQVIVTEIDPIKALEARMDGFTVMPIKQAAKIADVIITATGNKHVVSKDVIALLKNGAILANAGHFNIEIDVAYLDKMKKRKSKIRDSLVRYDLPDGKMIYLLAEGRLVNLSSAEGHPAEVMDMSFANQALAAEWIVKHQGKLSKTVHILPKRIDQTIAKIKLKALNVEIDSLTKEQKTYLASWNEGT